MNACDVVELLRRRYTLDEGWVLLAEVPNATGWAKRRTADAVAMNTWPSRGMGLHGFEVKVDRGDLVRELKHPEKADQSVTRYCAFWWLAVTRDVVRLDSDVIPDGWGVLEVDEKGKGFKVLRQAKEREAEPMARTFVASLLRTALKASPAEEELRAARSAGHDRAAEDQAKAVKGQVEGLSKEVERLREENMKAWGTVREALDAFKAATGIDLAARVYVYHGANLVPDLQRAAGVINLCLRDRSMGNTVRRQVEDLKRTIEQLDGVRSYLGQIEVSMRALEGKAPELALEAQG